MLRVFRRLVLLSLASIAAAGAHAQAPAMQISNTGEHACVLTAASGVACWGRNDEGQLGNGSAGAAFRSGTPVPVTGLSSGVVAVVTGYNHACALTTGGAVKCWGIND
jgi:alpha-tubulin suppressor-like RCC1 family protein